jgi:hypothetical protein
LKPKRVSLEGEVYSGEVVIKNSLAIVVQFSGDACN